MLTLSSKADVSLAAARRRLAAPARSTPVILPLIASGLVAAAALGLAGATILGPPPALAAAAR